MSTKLLEPFAGPSTWTRKSMEADKSWIYCLSPHEVEEIRQALKVAIATGKPLEEIERDDFPLPQLSARIRQLAEELETGRGFELWRGLPTDEWNDDERAVAYWGLGRHLGTPVIQNKRGELLGHVRNTTSTDPQTNVNSRFYHTNRAAPFHIDGADIVGLMCVRTAMRGGASLVVSSTSIYNAILRDRPDLIDLLYEPVWFDHRGERDAATLKPYWESSIAGWANGKLSMMYLRNYIESGQRYEGAPVLTDRHRELLELIDQHAESSELSLSMDFHPGDIQWLNNHVTLHSRTEFEDFEQPERRRWLMRLWLNQYERDRFTETYQFHGIAADDLQPS